MISTGSETTVVAGHNCARNSPCEVTKPVRYTGAVCATTPVSTFANGSSFQAKMKQIRAVAAMPGEMIGMMIRRAGQHSRRLQRGRDDGQRSLELAQLIRDEL